jgi:putative transposase
MARIARVVLAGHPHHVTQRGNRRQKVFFREADYRTYIDLLTEGCRLAATACWAYCLMPNHTHLVLVPQSPDGLRESLAEAHKRYTRHVNFRYGWRDHLWQERFHSFPMDEGHLLSCVRYVEQNPVKAGLTGRPEDWPWSSARAHLTGIDDVLVTVAPMLERVADWAAYLNAENEPDMHQTIHRHARTGRPLGSDAFLSIAERLTGRSLRHKKPGPKPSKENRF